MESKANVADGPTRDDLRILHILGASQVGARLPGWLGSLWTSIQADDRAVDSLLP